MKVLLMAVSLLAVSHFAPAQDNGAAYDYKGGNGTILSQTSSGETTVTIRKHEDRFDVWPSTMYRDRRDTIPAREEPSAASRELFRVKDNDELSSTEVAFVNDRAADKRSCWVKIRTDDGKTGWLDTNSRADLYADGVWSVTGIIKNAAREWTVRKLDGGVCVWEVLNVRDEPGVRGTKVLFQLRPTKDNPQLSVSILAITEQTETIDGRTDHWLKIEDDSGRTGWLFGGYTTIERGGPKYWTPAAGIGFCFSLP